MIEIPEKYKEVKKKHDLFIKRGGINMLDEYFYKLERTFIRPKFVQKKEVVHLAREFSNSKSLSSLKRKIRFFINRQLSIHNLNIEGFEKIDLKFNNIQSKTKSYFHYKKNTLFLSSKAVSNALNDEEYAKKLIYTILHEIAHAYSNRIFYQGRGHTPQFLHSLIIVLNSFCPTLLNGLFSTKQDIDGELKTFDEYCMKDGYFYRIRSSNMALYVADSFDKVVELINKDIPIPENEIGYTNGVSYFDKNHLLNTHVSIKGNGIFNDYSIMIVRKNKCVNAVVFKESQYYEEAQQFFLNYLEKEYQLEKEKSR